MVSLGHVRSFHSNASASNAIPEEDKLFLQAQGSFFDEGS